MKALKLLAFATLFAWAGLAQAGTCVDPYDDYVKNDGTVAACDLGTTNNDKLNPLQVNTDDMFGVSHLFSAAIMERCPFRLPYCSRASV